MALANGEWLQNRYRVISSLGVGGMGAIYQAQDTRLDVLVALKEMMPLPNLSPNTLTQLREQFQQEAKILARLKHPHLVRVSDYFVEHGNAYLVMDFIKGHNLAEYIRHRGPLPEEQVVTWGRQLLKALAYCHAQGIIHRDVKPQNVIIQSNGDAILVDFGLVKLWDPDDPRTKTAMHGMGTPEYAPPEQYGAKQEHCDARSDIYSLGATLYHALAGKAPPTATERIVNPESFKPLQVITPHVSKRTAQTVMKALELTPTQRWQRTEEMAEALYAPIPKPTEGPQNEDGPKEPPTPFPCLRKLLAGLKQNNLLTQPMRKVAFGVGSLAVCTFVIGLVVGIIPSLPDPTPSPIITEITISPTPSLSPSVTPSPSLTPTNSPTPPAPTPTKATAPTATSTPTQTPSPTPQPPTATPRP
ncbi:MAG: serine/threonine-protein kinase, partial [Anaerolineales bacterium]